MQREDRRAMDEDSWKRDFVDSFPPPRLRGVEKSDLVAIAELEATAFGTNSLTRSALDVIFDPSGGLWLLAEDDEGVWGHSVNVHGEDPNLGWIVGMAIHPERQRQGWGRVLLQATIERLLDYDMDVIRLLVKQDNKIARRLYETFGFHDTGQRIDHFGSGEDRLVMSLLVGGQEHAGTRAARGVSLVPQVPVDDGRQF
jgi:ribosomal-protein-alanine N-acetyltransferase